MIDVVQLLCELSEASDEVFRGNSLDPQWHDSLKVLVRLGAVESGPLPSTVSCSACDDDHPVAIEYDAEYRCYGHFCGNAGFVRIGNADLITHRFRCDWAVNWLVTSLPIINRARRSVLVPQYVWHLGDMTCNGKVVTVAFARRVVSQADLNQLASALHSIHPADNGVVITTSLHIARQVSLPGGYEPLALPEIVGAGPDGLVLDSKRLSLWIRGIQPTTAKGAPTRIGRPSPQTKVAQIFRQRRERGLPVESDSAEARAILAEWDKHAPDQEPPGRSTVRRHVARLPKVAAFP